MAQEPSKLNDSVIEVSLIDCLQLYLLDLHF